jgi:hypothetical protein
LPLSTGGSGLTKSGEALAVQPIIEIHDDYGNVDESETRNISVTLNRIGTDLDIKDHLISGSMDAVNGVAEFTSLAIVGRPGERYSLTFSAFQLDSVNTTNISGSEDLIVRHGNPTVLEITRQPSSVVSESLLTMTGSALEVQPKLRLLDFDGNLATEISGVSVTASVIPATGGEVVTAGGADQAVFSGGEATFSNLAVVAVPGSEQVVRFSTSVRDRLLTSADSNGFILTYAVAHRLAILTAPCAGEVVEEVCQIGITGDNLGVQPRIEIQDRFGNRVLNYQGSVRVSTSTSDGVLRNGSLIPQASVSVPVENGVATFTELNLEATPSVGIELLFESSNLLPVTADEIKVLAAEASQLVVIADPVGARTGAALPIVPIVELRDRFGNRALSDDVTRVRVMSLAGGAAAGTLSGELTATATAGRVTFTGLGFTGTPRSVYTLQFEAVDAFGTPILNIDELPIRAESGTFFVTNAVAARIVMVQTATVSRTGDVMGDTVIELRDAFNNLAEDNSTTVVRVSIVAGDVTKPKRFVDDADQTVVNPDGTISAIDVTASGGVVRFSGLRLVGIPGDGIELRFDATGHEPAFSGPLVLTHNEETSLSVTRGPVADLSGELLTRQPIISLFDRFGNSTTSDSSTVITASLFEGVGAELTAGTAATAVNGVVTFSGLTATGIPGNLNKLRFTFGTAPATYSVDDSVGFKVKKNAVTTLSYTETSFRPNGTVLPAFATDSDAVSKTFTTDTPAVCSVNSATGIITMLTVGDCDVTVDIPTTDNYYSLDTVSATLKINKAAQSPISITTTLSVDHLGTLALNFTGGDGQGRLIYSATGDCRAIGTTLLAGSAREDDDPDACYVRVERLGDRDYLPSTPSDWAPVTVRKIEPEELFIGNNPTVTGGEVQLFTRGGSGNGEIWFEKVNTAQSCTVSRAGLATSDAGGACRVRARQAESAHHLDNMVEVDLTFNKVEQTVSFTSAVPQDVRVGQTYIPVAVASSELAVSYSIAAGSAGVCSIASSSPFTVTFATVGLCEIVATQAGNSRFSPASATRPISVGLRNQTITFTLTDSTLLFGTPSFRLSATASSGEPVSYSVATSPTPACSVVGGRVTLTRAGVCIITATQPGIANVLAPATPVTQVLTVTPDLAGAPHLMSISVGDRSITSRFMPPGYLGGSAVSGYVMEVTNGSATYSNYACSPDASQPCTITGIPRLTQGKFEVRVAAITNAGIGNFSEWSKAIEFREAGLAVRNLVAPISGEVLRLAWEAPLIRDGFTSYEVYAWPQDVRDRPAQSAASVTSIDANGVNLNLASLPETTSGLQIEVVTVVTPPSQLSEEQRMAVAKTIGFTTPSAPWRIGISDMTNEIMVAWSPPLQDGGQAVMGYQVFVNGELSCSVEIDPATEVCPDAAEMNFTVSELEPGGAYVIRVAAMNSMGLGAMREIEHRMPALPVASGPDSLLDGLPSLPGRPSKPGSGSGPNVMDPDSWIPATPDSPAAEEPKAPSGPSDGTDTSASGADTEEANFTWLMLLLALLMVGALLRVVIRGRKLRSLRIL